jgi:hypothetical protein
MFVFYVLEVSVKRFWFFIVENSVKTIPFVIFVCGSEHFPANLIKSVWLKIYCFAMYLAVNLCLDFNQFPPDFSTTEDHNCNNTRIDWWRTIWRRIRICCATLLSVCKRRNISGLLHCLLGNLFHQTTSFLLGIAGHVLYSTCLFVD